MLPKLRNPFKVEEDERISNKGTVVVGLQILVQISHGKSNIVVKSASVSASTRLPGCKTSQHSCYLKSCFLCNKKLSFDKDVYMYRGDQGFCSIECRNRQIYLDETKELENSTKQKIASYRRCSTNDRRETQILLKELRQRHQKPQYSQKIQWAIAS